MTFILRASLLALALAASVAGIPSSGDAATTVDLKLLSVSRWLGQVEPIGTPPAGGAAALAALWRAERTAGTLTLGTGNSFGTSPPISNLFDDEPAAFAMNLMGFDADTLGNDNFDHGIAYLQRIIDLSQFTYLSANLQNLEANLRTVRRYRIFERQGVKVAVIGITDPRSPARVFPGNFGTLTVSDPFAAAVQAREDAARQGAQVFVMITELGLNVSSNGVASGELLDLARRLQGFDAILGAGGGADYSATINGALVVASQDRGASYARTTLRFDGEAGRVVSRTAAFVTPLLTSTVPDDRATALIASYRAQLAGRLSRVVATSAFELPQTDNCGQAEGRTCESITGNAIADILRSVLGTDIAIMNSGGIRAGLTCPSGDRGDDFCPPAGAGAFPITAGQVEAVLPFGNIAVSTSVSGAQLKAMLENGVSGVPDQAIGRFPQISGFCFAYDISRAVGSRVTAAVRQGPDGGCGSTALGLTEASTYTLATNDFIAAGGDGYAAPTQPVVRGGPLVSVVTNYLLANPAVGAALQGRIVCVSSGPVACPTLQVTTPAFTAGASPSIRPPSTGDAGVRQQAWMTAALFHVPVTCSRVPNRIGLESSGAPIMPTTSRKAFQVSQGGHDLWRT